MKRLLRPPAYAAPARRSFRISWLTRPYERQIDESNAYVYQAAKAHADRLLGFDWADPRLGVQRAKDMVRKCADDYGFLGVKLNGAQNDFFIDDLKVSMPMVEEIAKTGKLIAFHCGVDACEWTHRFRIATIARPFPQMQILCAYMGAWAFPIGARRRSKWPGNVRICI